MPLLFRMLYSCGLRISEALNLKHDRLMMKLATRVKDKKVLILIRKYLQAGVMEGGLVKPTAEGTPQGGLSKALDKPPYQK
jgi:retron-type reverse transcriptase